MGRTNTTEAQERKAKTWASACDTMAPWFGPKAPNLNNLTNMGLIDLAGPIGILEKDAKKCYAIYKDLLKVRGLDAGETRADSYMAKFSSFPTTRLNQEKAKEILSSIGRLAECMDTDDQTRLEIKEI
jgi:hypothetical protein